MSKRIGKKELAELLGIHEKTVERYIGDGVAPASVEFRQKTGYHKNEMSGRISFDDRFSRIYAANVTGNDDLRTADEVIDAEAIEVQAIEKAAPVAVERSGPVVRANDQDFTAAFLLPHKLLLTPREAAQLTGLSQKLIREHSEKISGKWKITRSYLQVVVNDLFANALFANAKPTGSKGRSGT